MTLGNMRANGVRSCLSLIVAAVSDRLTLLVLIKANVCQILKPKLVQDGFRVLNGGIVIPFPSHGRQPEFHEKFGPLIKSAGI
jgi:hypothetical protein